MTTGRFGKIYLEITNVCNLSCDFCPVTERPGQFLSLDNFQVLLTQLRGWGRDLFFHVKGEPLLHPQLGDLLTVAGEAGFTVTLTTNGSLLGKWGDRILASPAVRQVNVSLHSQGGIDDAQYWQGLEAFLDAHRLHPAFPLSLRIWNLRSGLVPPDLERLWRHLAHRYPQLGDWENPTRAASTTLDARVFLNQEEQFSWPDLKLDATETRGFCHGLGNQIAVLVDGTVVPCCLDGQGVMALGNLLTTPLNEILQSPRALAISKGFAERRLVEPLCQRCGFRKRFG